jgi:hypothetical protein
MHTLDVLDSVCYNTFLTHTKQTMQNTKSKLDSLMLQLQTVLEEAELDEHVAIQNAFNALACALDDTIIA